MRGGDYRSEYRSYCVDAGLIPMVGELFRRLVLVYPESACVQKPLEGARVVRSRLGVYEVFRSLTEACSEASELLAHGFRPSYSRYLSMLPPTREEARRHEAYQALSLCRVLFGEEHTLAALASHKPSFVVYDLGDRRSVTARRLRSLLRIDGVLAENLSRALGQPVEP